MGTFSFMHRRAVRRLITAALVMSFVLGLVGGLTPAYVGAQTTPASPTLDARIGGTVASFETNFGEPTNSPAEDVAAKRNYKNKNYQYLTTQAVDGYVYRVTFSSDRKSADPETKKTWTKSKATSIAKRFLPSDAQCAEASPYKSNKALRTTCTSVALTAIMFPADYERVSRVGEHGSVSFVLTLDKKGGSKVTAIEAIVGAMSAEEAAALQPTPTATTVADPYYASGPATEAEKAYFRQVKGIIAQLLVTTDDVTSIMQRPGFSSDVSQWFLLLGAVDPYHSIYAQWQMISVPTARLEAFHQAMTDTTYNLNQFATNYELALDTVDATYLQLAIDNMNAGTDAIGRAMTLMADWEAETGFDVSEDL